MSNDKERLRRISSHMSEDDRRAQLAKASDVRRDIEATLGTDVVKHEALVRIAWTIWNGVPAHEKPKYTAEDWRHAIYNRCAPALKTAEERIENSEGDQRLISAKIKLLRQGFAQQVHRAMQEIAEGSG